MAQKQKAGTTEEANRLISCLRSVRDNAETELERLGRKRDAWTVFDVHFDGTNSPGLGYSRREAEQRLGKQYRVVRKATKPTQELPAWRQIQRLARRLVQREHVTEQQAVDRLLRQSPRLYEQYRKQWLAVCEQVEETKPWRQAQVAAVAGAALTRTTDPEVMFAVGWMIREHGLLERFPELRRKAAKDALSKMQPDIDRGRKVLEAAKESRRMLEPELQRRRQERQERAAKIWTNKPTLSVRNVALRMQAEGFGGFEAIRKQIKKHGTPRKKLLGN